MIGSLGEHLARDKKRASDFSRDGTWNGGMAGRRNGAVVVVNLPIAESEHHNFRCRARPARGDISSAFPLSRVRQRTR